jgi:hypothetical protein
MLDDAVRNSAVNLATPRIVALQRILVAEVGTIVADLVDRGFPNSNLRVVYIKGAGERNLIQRAEYIKNAIIQVCEAKGVKPSSQLGEDLTELFDEIYQEHVNAVTAFVDKRVSDEAKKLCPLGELKPEVGNFREEIILFTDKLPAPDVWSDIVVWFRSKWWSVPFVLIFVCLPLIVQWIQMLQTVVEWLKK